MPSYKQTEAGVIPQGWTASLLGTLTTHVSSGRSSVRFTAGDFPVYGSTGVIGYTDFPDYVGRAILVARVGANAGRLNLVAGRYGVSDNTIILRIGGVCDVDFIWRQLEAQQLNRLVFGSGQPLITGTQLKSLHLALPKPSEQRVIAAALSDVDALLAGLDKLIAKKRDLKQAAMQQLFTGKTRLPSFSGEWELKRLGAIGETFGGLTGKTKEDFGCGNAQYITFMNVMTNVVIDCDIFDRVHMRSGESQNSVRKGDVLFNGSSETPEEVALCSLLNLDVKELYLNSFCFGFRFFPAVDVDGAFFVYYIRSNTGRELMKGLAQGSTRYNISKTALLESKLLMPGLAEQVAIAKILFDIDAELVALETRLSKTRALKQAMMQELLTGRIRLVDPEPKGELRL